MPKSKRQKQNGSLISDSVGGHYDWGHFKSESLRPVALPGFMPRPCWIGHHWLRSRREGSLEQGKGVGIGWIGATSNRGFATSKQHRWAVGNPWTPPLQSLWPIPGVYGDLAQMAAPWWDLDCASWVSLPLPHGRYLCCELWAGDEKGPLVPPMCFCDHLLKDEAALPYLWPKSCKNFCLSLRHRGSIFNFSEFHLSKWGYVAQILGSSERVQPWAYEQ